MTTRERVSLLLVLAGAIAVVTAAVLLGDWRVGLAVAGVLVLLLGILLGIDSDGGVVYDVDVHGPLEPPAGTPR